MVNYSHVVRYVPLLTWRRVVVEGVSLSFKLVRDIPG